MESPKIAQKIAQTIDHIPPMPQVAARVFEIMANPEASCEDLTEVISRDPALASKILGLSNSPYYKRVDSIESLGMAIMVLGFGTIHSLVMTISIGMLLGHSISRRALRKIWEHSVATALLSELLGKQIGLRDREKYYIAGLIHDVGKLVLCKLFPEKFQRTLDRFETDTIPSFEAEKEEFGFDHTQLGTAVLQKWGLPEALHKAVAHHHHPDRFGEDEVMTPLVHIADKMAHEILEPETAGRCLTDPVAMARVQLNEEDIANIASQSKEMILENLAIMARI